MSTPYNINFCIFGNCHYLQGEECVHGDCVFNTKLVRWWEYYMITGVQGGGITYTDDEIVGKINTAIAKITRANSIEIAAILESETQKLMLATEREKLDAIEVGAQVNPPDLATLDPEADAKLVSVDERLNAYEAEILPPGAIEATFTASGLDLTRIQRFPAPGAWLNSPTQADVGYLSSGYYGGGISLRFIANIPKTAIIKRTWFILTCSFAWTSTGILRSEIGIEDVANATRINSLNDFLNRPRVAVAWDNIEIWTLSAQYKSPSLVTLIQRVIDKPEWEKGNAIQIFWDDRLDRSDHIDHTDRQVWLNKTGSNPKLYVAYVES